MLAIITGPSGVGKTTIMNSLLEADPSLQYSTSLTSRQPRSGEVDGIDYRFVSLREFQEKIENDEFVEWSEVYGKYYGRLKSDLENLMRCGDVLIVIDVQGAKKFQNTYPEGVFIFMLPKSEPALEAQLRGRKADSEATTRIRLNTALQEMKQADDFDYKVVNNRIDETVREIQSILNMEKTRFTDNPERG